MNSVVQTEGYLVNCLKLVCCLVSVCRINLSRERRTKEPIRLSRVDHAMHLDYQRQIFDVLMSDAGESHSQTRVLQWKQVVAFTEEDCLVVGILCQTKWIVTSNVAALLIFV